MGNALLTQSRLLNRLPSPLDCNYKFCGVLFCVLMYGETINYGEGSTLVVGSGLAGLATAIKIKQAQPQHAVTVVDKPHHQSNSLIAGQRFREGVTGIRTGDPNELANLLASRNDSCVTPEMKRFANIACQELSQWQSFSHFIDHSDSKSWFGPQWGSSHAVNRGRSVIGWFTDFAHTLGVQFISAEVDKVSVHESGMVAAIEARDSNSQVLMRANNYVLAAGNAGGYLFESTNRAINKSGTELLFEAGLKITDSTVHMFHPFGKTNKRGSPVVGCHETDNLSKARVYLDGLSKKPVFDSEATELLHMHEAHYHFPELTERFSRFGGIVLLIFPDDTSALARVSHHYSHFGIPTHDGVRSSRLNNLFVVGDTAGAGYWTNNKERFPGFALTKSLVDAKLVADSIVSEVFQGAARIQMQRIGDNQADQDDDHKCKEIAVRKVNTRHLLAWMSGRDDADHRRAVTQSWVAELGALGYDNSQVRLSKYVAMEHAKEAK